MERAHRHETTPRSIQSLAGKTHRVVRSGAGARARTTAITHHLLSLKLSGAVTVLVLIAALLLPGAQNVASQGMTDCGSDLATPTIVTSVYVQPDAGFAPVLDEIDQARCTVDISMYLFTSDEVLASLQEAELRGVRVRVLLDEIPFGTFGTQQEIFDQLVEIGADVRWSPSTFTYSHAKYLLVDDHALLVTNQNFTGAGFTSNREFGIVTTDPRYVSEAVRIFDADWSGFTGPQSFEHLVVSPVNSRQTILDLINGSKVSVWMYAEVLRDEEITTALDDAVSRGVDVRLLVNPSADEEDAPYFLDVLDHGVQVRVLNAPYVHSKALVVDGTSVLIGSQNYSYTSLNLNREVGIVLTDATSLEIVGSTFLRDWSRAEPVDTVSLGVDYAPGCLTLAGRVGKLSSGRWGVV